MKKAISILLSAMMVLSLAACGKKDDDKSKKKSKKDKAQQEEVEDDEDGKKSKKKKSKKGEASATVSLNESDTDSDTLLVITVKSEGLEYEKNPWVGILPDGDYANEDEADGADIWYEYITEENQEFSCYVGSTLYDSGDYIVVVCDRDSDVDGAILATAKFHFEETAGPSLGDNFAEYGQGDWEYYYPTAMVCPFSIGEYSLYWPTGFDGEPMTIYEWTSTPCNWPGWKVVENYIVSADETVRITNESIKQNFCSCCSYDVQPYDPNDVSGNYILMDGAFAYDRFLDLVEDNNGFQINYTNKDDTVNTLVGGKDNTFWFITTDFANEETHYMIAVYDPSAYTWKTTEQWVYPGAEQQEEPQQNEDDWLCIDRILELAYRDQYHIVEDTIVSIEDVEMMDRYATKVTHNNGSWIAVIDDEFGFSLQHENVDDDSYNIMCTEFAFGDEVEIPTFVS